MWMKVSEIGRYWAAKELTQLHWEGNTLQLEAPFACENFTLRLEGVARAQVKYQTADKTHDLRSVSSLASLHSGQYFVDEVGCMACIDLPRGSSQLRFG